MSTQPNWMLTIANAPWITKLTPAEEQEFRLWVQHNKIPVNPDDAITDYDMRGFWKAMKGGDVEAVRNHLTGHFSDRWKTPFHKTFSNESQYRTPNAPHWRGNDLLSPEGKAVFREK